MTWKRSGITAFTTNLESTQKTELLCWLKPQETQNNAEKRCAQSSSRLSVSHNSMSLSKLSFPSTPPVELLVWSLILVMELPTLSQSMKVILFHMLLWETTSLVEILLHTLPKSWWKPVKLSKVLLNSKLWELLKKKNATLLLISIKKWKNSKNLVTKMSNLNSQTETSLPSVTNNSDAQKLCLILLDKSVKKCHQSINSLTNLSKNVILMSERIFMRTWLCLVVLLCTLVSQRDSKKRWSLLLHQLWKLKLVLQKKENSPSGLEDLSSPPLVHSRLCGSPKKISKNPDQELSTKDVSDHIWIIRDKIW